MFGSNVSDFKAHVRHGRTHTQPNTHTNGDDNMDQRAESAALHVSLNNSATRAGVGKLWPWGHVMTFNILESSTPKIKKLF